MSDLFIARPTTSDAAVLDGGNADTSYPITNLQVQQPKDYYRTTDNTSTFFTVDLGAAVAVNVIALLYTNADTSTQWQIRGATSEANLTASPGYNSGTIDHWPDADNSDWDRTHALKFLSTAETFRWWRIDISGLSGLDYYQAGRLYIDSAYNPTRSADIGLSLDRIDYSLGAESQYSHFRKRGKQQRNVSMTFSARQESEAYNDHMDLQRKIGMGGDVLVCHEASSRVMDRLIYSYLAEMGPIVHGQYSPTYTGHTHTINYNFVEFEHP